jgi:hypothetical protein
MLGTRLAQVSIHLSQHFYAKGLQMYTLAVQPAIHVALSAAATRANHVVVSTIARIQEKPVVTSDHVLLDGIAALLELAIQKVDNAALLGIIVQLGTFAFSWMGRRNAARIHAAQLMLTAE